MRLAFDVDGTVELKGVLARMREAGQDPRPAFEEVADYFTDRAADAFRTQGRAIGVRWPRLSRQYVRYRKAGPVGVQTGVLRRSMTQPGARGYRRRLTRQRVEVVSTAPHAHLFAGGRGGQPARPLVNIRPPERRAVAGILQRHLSGGGR